MQNAAGREGYRRRPSLPTSWTIARRRTTTGSDGRPWKAAALLPEQQQIHRVRQPESPRNSSRRFDAGNSAVQHPNVKHWLICRMER